MAANNIAGDYRGSVEGPPAPAGIIVAVSPILPPAADVPRR